MEVEVTCENCQVLFKMSTDRFEKAQETHCSFLCNDCSNKLMLDLEKQALPLKKCFEYLADIICGSKSFDLSRINELGKEGWEVVLMMNDSEMLFKREYYREA